MIKGWCPGALRPMESGDGLIVRLKISCGVVDLALAEHIAGWSQRWGNGQIDLTNRANLQLRGVSVDSLPFLQDALAEQGLLDGNIGGEAVRNVISSPLAWLDPGAVLDVRPLVKALEDRLAGDAALHDLPAKFGFLIDGGGWLGLGDVRADVRFAAVDGPAFAVGLDGVASEWFGPIDPGQLVETAIALARVFPTHQGPDIRRMRDLVERIGAAAIAADVGLAGASFEQLGGGAGASLGLFEIGAAFLGVGLPFGRIAAGELANVAQCAADSGATEIRLTPWRAILIPLPTIAAAKALSGKLAPTDFILDPADPRRRVAACSGAPSCLHGTTSTRDDATRLAALIDSGSFLHVSGCAKGCAHPRSAPVTFVGRDGLYDVVYDGVPSDSPLLSGLTLDEAAEHLRQMAAKQSQGGTA
jgi:precorrin-3B synthase